MHVFRSKYFEFHIAHSAQTLFMKTILLLQFFPLWESSKAITSALLNISKERNLLVSMWTAQSLQIKIERIVQFCKLVQCSPI
jgi:hypothetical protein